MKKPCALLSIVFVASNIAIASGQVTIIGKIKNPQGDVVTISKDGLFNNEPVHEAKVNKQGDFTANFEISEEGYYSLYHGKEYTPLYLRTGDNLGFSIDTENFDETVAYTGTGAAANNYLAAQLLLEERLRPEDWKAFYGLEPQAFVDKCSEIKAAREAFLAEYTGRNPELTADFIRYAKAQINYAWAGNMTSYPSYHKAATGNEIGEFNERIGALLAPLRVYDKQLLAVTAYRDFLGQSVIQEAKSVTKANPEIANKQLQEVVQIFRIMNATIPNQDVKDYLMTNLLNNKIRYGQVTEVSAVLDQYKSSCSNKEYLAMIEEGYKQWAHLAPGNPAPDFTYADMNGNKFSLKDFRGKYVYIDVWATWCGPCKQEIPHLKELEEACKNYNIEFIGISLDGDKKKWQEMVREKDIKGLQLLADKEFNSELAKAYNISGIPRFILIDRQGNIIDVNAPRPSGEIKAIIDALEDIRASR